MRPQYHLALWVLMGMLSMVGWLPVQAQEPDWRAIAGELMSPACPGRTLLNCTSAHAEQWRELIRQKLAQGESRPQILQYFVDMNGEGILAAPPKRGFALTAWLLPAFVVLNGAGLILLLTWRWARKKPANAVEHVPQHVEAGADKAVTDPYLIRLHQELEQWRR